MLVVVENLVTKHRESHHDKDADKDEEDFEEYVVCVIVLRAFQYKLCH